MLAHSASVMVGQTTATYAAAAAVATATPRAIP